MKHPRRIQALERWSAIAAGQIDDEARKWLAEVAKGVLAANEHTDPDAFRPALAAAVGLTGHRGPALDPVIREIAEAFGADALTDPEKREHLRTCVRALRNDHLERKISVGAIDAQIRRAVGKIAR